MRSNILALAFGLAGASGVVEGGGTPEVISAADLENQKNVAEVPAQPNGTATVTVDPASLTNLTYPIDYKFRFNKDPKTEKQRTAVEVKFDVPSFAGIIAVVRDGFEAVQMPEEQRTEDQKKNKKVIEYLIELAGDAVIKEVRGYVADNENASQDTIPWKNYTFREIALMPAGIRGASSIAKELWEKFAKSYIAVMQTVGVTAETAAVRVGVFLQKFRSLTGNAERKAIIENLMGTLAVFIEKAPNSEIEEYKTIIEFLNKKADELKKDDQIVTKDALGFN